ncbi:MAG: ATP-dependent DNA helicase RecG, partial [Lachnospiraceae bacterium]|nr:ATP-dependent DNA helicase RecG [Lachnospiraceae bacterium]
IHFPQTEADLFKGHGRLVFDEFLTFLVEVSKLKKEEEQTPNQFPMIECADTNRILESLPYELTDDQKKVWEDLKEDLSGKYAMNRLVQGDVGSGKTILAVLALAETAANGFQGALMAPTEVLALQHFETIRELSRKLSLNLTPVLLTGSLSAKDKRTVYELISSGSVNCIIGTHALFQEKAEYKNLALVITDEQHRFGVHQREELIKKGKMPHVCVMSATPIPRTLALILYGDMHISTIRHLPNVRKPIKNAVIPASDRPKAYRFIEKQVKEGRQAFIICPMISPSEMGDEDEGGGIELENVTDYAKKIKEVFPDLSIGILHGKMKPADKNTVMYAFARGEIHVLVSTTVVEVGVNVPNASVMMIENAERFGLAQLHQLRGRVGRGEYQSYCIFINTSDSDKSKDRLHVLETSNDGFAIAEKDLSLRGPGDLFGIRQSGALDFKLADIYQDANYLQMAKEVCDRYPIDIPSTSLYHFTNL